MSASFPIDLSEYEPVEIDLADEELTADQLEQLRTNVDICRDAIIFFTGYADAKGVGGHTGGAYSIVPEVLIADGIIRGPNDNIHPTVYDEAGHRVAIHYLMAALDEEKKLSPEDLLHYREYDSGLPGHPELDDELGIEFSSGRLGHMWADANGIAHQTGDQVIVFGSDGSQQEGNDAEAARIAVAHDLNVSVIVDNNDVTIEGYPRQYLPGFSVAETLKGHGMNVEELDVGRSLELQATYDKIRSIVQYSGPSAFVNTRVMAPNVPGIEGSNAGHDAISPEDAIDYLDDRGYDRAIEMIEEAPEVGDPVREEDPDAYRGCSDEVNYNRSAFGESLLNIMDEIGAEGRQNVMVYSADLGGSTRVSRIEDEFPERYVKGGVMERGLFSAAAGFGANEDSQGIFATFSVFGSEMILSEVAMARLNDRDVLCHFSHAGVDWMADSNCHYGVNISALDNGFFEDNTRLYFPADPNQVDAVTRSVFDDEGIRIVFTIRSKVPYVLDESGEQMFDRENGYEFTPGEDELIRGGTDGYVVSYGEMLYRCLDAVEQLNERGLDVGLINKPTLNVPDEDMLERVGSSPAVLFVEGQNEKTGFGNRYAKWLSERGLSPRFKHMGVTKEGGGGIWEHVLHQELGPSHIRDAAEELMS